MRARRRLGEVTIKAQEYETRSSDRWENLPREAISIMGGMSCSDHESGSAVVSRRNAGGGVCRLRQCEAWVFDLDNTLYPASLNLFPQIDQRMKTFIARALNLEPEDALRLQKKYYLDYGTTLRGLMLCHDLDPEEFLDYVHTIDHSVLESNPVLDDALAALPGRKLVFTNGPEAHAINVLACLGVERHFEAIFDIRAAGYIPKPDPQTYQRLVVRHRIQPERTVMVEDTLQNLRPAAAIGMTTVWLRPAVPDDPPSWDSDTSHCHYIIDDLPVWLAGRAIG
ncbi:MAG: putative hydrolase of the HAD superfamily [Rhodospirillaceae bacterium]|nr:MAG: putative hydrolase of the HAD superfamily [Rhodospirillaceae bacterium]